MEYSKEVLEKYAKKADCATINLDDSNEFARVWIICIVTGIGLILMVNIPFFWCGSDQKAFKAKVKKEMEDSFQKAKTERKDGFATGNFDENPLDSPTVDYEAAKKHLIRTSPCDKGKWRNPFTFPMWKLNYVGGAGAELYFHMLRNLGFCFAYMAALTFPISAFSMYGDFGPDTGQALARLTIGNLGNFVDPKDLAPQQRIVQIGCQGMELSKLTPYMGWLDILAALLFLCFICYFRFYRIPKSAKESDEEQVTCSDFSVEISGLPRTIADHKDYERLLSEHILGRLKHVRQVKKSTSPEPQVVEVTLVRDYGGRLSQIKERALLARSREIAECYKTGDASKDPKVDKKLDKLDNKLEKLDAQLAKRLEADDALPVVRAYVILNLVEDVTNLLFDYRFADYSLFRCCQFNARRFEGKPLRVRKAPQPTNIIWENQDVTWTSRLLRRLFMLLVFILIIVISLAAIYFLTAYAASHNSSTLSYIGVGQCDPVQREVAEEDEYKCLVTNATTWTRSYGISQGPESDRTACYCSAKGYDKIMEDDQLLSDCEDWLISTGTGVGVMTLSSIVVAGINVCLQICLIAMAEFERPLSITVLNSSMMQKIALAQTINTGYVMFIVNLNGGQVLQDLTSIIPGVGKLLFRGSFQDLNRGWYAVVGVAIMTNMLMNAVVPASVSMVKMFVAWGKRRFLSCCATVRHQAELLEIYTNPEFDIKLKYAQLMVTVFVTMSYSAGMPALYLFASIYMFCMYWSDKITLLWGSQRPPMYDTAMAKQSSELMLYSVALHCVFAVAMYGQECVFPSDFIEWAAVSDQASDGGYSNDLLTQLDSRIRKEATWMSFAVLVLLISLWVLWCVAFVIGGTFGEFWKCLKVTCCPSRSAKVSDADVAASIDWVMAESIIESQFPPASYRMDRHPAMFLIAKQLRDPGAFAPSKTGEVDQPAAEVVGAPVLASTAQSSKSPPVSEAVARGFLKALRDEYIEGQEGAVGAYFDNIGASAADQEMLGKFEESVRAAEDKSKEITVISESWGLDLTVEST